MNYSKFRTKDLPGEEWRQVVDYEGLYEVSNLGRVKSCKRQIPAVHSRVKSSHYMRTISEKILRPKRSNGYHRYWICQDGVATIISGHRLVATAFLPNPERKPQVNHIDGNPSNNRLENLEWVTQKENNIHARRTGLVKYKSGDQHHKTKVTDAQRRIIAQRFLLGKEKQADICKDYGITPSAVAYIVKPFRNSDFLIEKIEEYKAKCKSKLPV